MGLRAIAVVIGALALATCAAPQEDATQAAKKPNVIVILADDLGFADISSYGIHRIETPNIDRIGNDGMKFATAYSAAPVCSPSRAGLQTGRAPTRYGFEYNNGPAARDIEQNLGLDKGELTLASALKGGGYHTGIIGKWHLGANAGFYPTDRGYDEFVGFLPGATAYISPTAQGIHYVRPDGAEADPLRPRGPNGQIIEGSDRKVIRNEDQYLTDYFGDRAVDYVKRNAAADSPYFLYLAFNAPHDPFVVTDKYYQRFPQIRNEHARIYAAMISALDDNIGRVIDAVDASGEGRDTIIYFASDNGCAAYFQGLCACEPLRGGKLSHYEGGVRVPFMMRWPAKVQKGSVYSKMVSTMDVFPTTLAAAGVAKPTDRVYDGVDLGPYISGKNKSEPHEMLAWRRTPMASIRKGDWKLWRSTGEQKFDLLFNLKDDPNETKNLAASRPDKLKELNAAFDSWAKDLQDPRWPSRPALETTMCGVPFTLPI